MNINIQISDEGVATRSQGGQDSAIEIKQSVAAASIGHQDGGAPSAQLTGSESSNSAGADVSDIGAPPQWLYDAVGSGKEASGSVSSSDVSSSDGSDGGGPPSFE